MVRGRFGIAENIAFPQPHDRPACGFERSRDFSISCCVSREFGHPPLSACVLDRRTQCRRPLLKQHARVPKVAVDEDGNSLPRKGQVRLSGKVLSTQPEAKPTSPEKAAEQHLSFAVARANGCHIAGHYLCRPFASHVDHTLSVASLIRPIQREDICLDAQRLRLTTLFPRLNTWTAHPPPP
jgi:hypothetical protein